MFGKKKKGKKDYPEMVDSIQGSPKEEPDYGRDPDRYNSYLQEPEAWPEDMTPLDAGNGDAGKEERGEAVFEGASDGGYDTSEAHGQPDYNGVVDNVGNGSASSGIQQGYDGKEEYIGKHESGASDDQPVGNEKAPKKSGKSQKKTVSRIAEQEVKELSAREQARLARQKRRKREMRAVHIAMALLVILVLAAGALAGYYVLEQKDVQLFGSDGAVTAFVRGLIPAKDAGSSGNDGSEVQTEPAITEMSSEAASEQAARIEQADQMAAQADYDGAIALLKEQAGYESNRTLQEKVAGYETDQVLAQAEAKVIQADYDGAIELLKAQTGYDSNTVLQAKAEEYEQIRTVVQEADLKAAQYDYDGAAALLTAQDGYESNSVFQAKVEGYEASKAACVEISPDTVSHVFVHSLIVDPSRAFDGDSAQDGYNLNMVTVDEFKKIIQSLYDNGYVLVSLHDMGEIDENGQMQRKSIWLPEGKKPLVFSQDDVSYYHSYSGDGFADRLIVDENGDVKNEYTDAEGNTTVGDYDMVPILDTFIEEHPDFSYHGRKGIVVLTGYNGVLGYRTDGDYKEQANLQDDQRKWLEEHPDFDYDADVAAATAVADAMKANGWEFASHTWGHISVDSKSLEELQADTQKWLDYVQPIVGETDMIIFAFGADIGDWTGYSSDNEKFNYLKSVGFNYFCNVDGSTLNWVQFGDTYLRQARMNLDGYRMATNPDILSPLFDVSEVYDTSRPEMPAWGQ
jgi:hypothetical protein